MSAILYDSKITAEMLTIIQRLQNVYREHYGVSFQAGGDNSSQNISSDRPHLDKLFLAPNSGLLSLWGFYSAPAYPEVFYSLAPNRGDGFVRKPPAPYDIFTKRAISHDADILVCNKCQRYSMDSDSKFLGNNNRQVIHAYSTRRPCICGGIWRRLNVKVHE